MCTTDVYTFIRADDTYYETHEVHRCFAYRRGDPCNPVTYQHPVSTDPRPHPASSPTVSTETPVLRRKGMVTSQKQDDPQVSDSARPSVQSHSPIDDKASSDHIHTYDLLFNIGSDSDSDAYGQDNLGSTVPSGLTEADRERIFVLEDVSESDPTDGKVDSILQPDGYESADSEGSSSSSQRRTGDAGRDDWFERFRNLEAGGFSSEDYDIDLAKVLEFMRQRELKRRNRIHRGSHLGMRTISETEFSDNEALPSSATEARNGPAHRKKMRKIENDSGAESLPTLKPATTLDVEDELADAPNPRKPVPTPPIPRLEHVEESKVSVLAKNFEQLSREFENQRLRDMEKRVEKPAQSGTQVGHADRADVDDETEPASQPELLPEATSSPNAALPVNLEDSYGDLEALLDAANSAEDELESIVSAMPSLTTASTLSSFAVPANLIDTAPGWVLELLAKDEVMRNLLASTSSKITPDKFQRNFLRLFRSMLSGIKADSNIADGNLRTGLRFLRHQSRNISSHICKEIFGIKDGEDWSALSRMRPDKSWQMKKYLAEYGQAGYPGDHAHLNEGEISSDSDLAGVDSVGIGTLTRQRLEVILLQSRSFLEFRERYQKFLFPDLAHGNADKGNAETDNTENGDAEGITSCPNDLNIEQQLESNLGMRQWIAVAYTSLVRVCHRITRPPLKQGYRRLEWTCVS